MKWFRFIYHTTLVDYHLWKLKRIPKELTTAYNHHLNRTHYHYEMAYGKKVSDK